MCWRRFWLAAVTMTWESSAYLNFTPQHVSSIRLWKKWIVLVKLHSPEEDLVLGQSLAVAAINFCSQKSILMVIRNNTEEVAPDSNSPCSTRRPFCHTLSEVFSKSRFIKAATFFCLFRFSCSIFILNSDLVVFLVVKSFLVRGRSVDFSSCNP